MIGGATSTYAYNGDGLRDSRTVGEDTVTFTWDLARSMPQVIDDGSLAYVYGLGRISQVAADDTTYYYLSDGLGSTMALTDADGDVVNTYDYDVFGAVRGSSGSQPNEFQFAGEQLDASTNLQYLRARYYDPAQGRFLGRDPILGNNPYSYVGSNPVNLVDPLGLCGWRDPWTCVGEGADKLSDIAYDLMPSNAQFLFDFATGTGNGDRYYGPSSAEVRGLRGSAGAQKIRDAFVANGCKTKNGIAYETGEAFWDTFLHPLSPAAQVGGFAGASATRVASDSKEGNDMLRIRIENEAGLRSFFYHHVPNSPFGRGPGRTIHQTFDWEEPLPAACQN